MTTPWGTPAGPPPVRPASPPVSPGSGASALLTVLGLLVSGIGLWYLFNPSVEVSQSLGYGVSVPSEVVNLQRLTMGETFTIASADFLAAAWRPR